MRANAPRSSQARCVRERLVNALQLIEESNAGRIAGLVPLKNARMAQSPFAFFRGCAIVQARDLAATPASGALVQLCGDCHLMNFGGFATPERNLVFDLNDFDESFPGPWEWDVKRLAASAVLAARDRGFSNGVAAEAVRAAVAAYRERTWEYAAQPLLDVWYARIAFSDLRDFFDRNSSVLGNLSDAEAYARRRTSEHVFPKLATIENGRVAIADNPPLIYHFHEHVKEASALMREFFARYRRTLSADRRHLFDRYVLADIAIKVVGVGSVGTRCAIGLFLAESADPLFLQVKEARRSVLESPDGVSGFTHQGERVVTGQRLMQAASDIFLGWAEISGSSDYYVRQLRDMKVSVDIDSFRSSTLVDYAGICGWALARAHAKAGDPATVAGYLGKSDRFDDAIVSYAQSYADRVERDYEEFKAAIASGRFSVETGEFREPDFIP